jgi:hypothetical protein
MPTGNFQSYLQTSSPSQGRFKVALMAKAWTMQGWHGPLARPAGLPARLSGAGRTVGNGLRMQIERLTRTTLVCNRSLMPDFRAPLSPSGPVLTVTVAPAYCPKLSVSSAFSASLRLSHCGQNNLHLGQPMSNLPHYTRSRNMAPEPWPL